jgi:lipid-A-disaccharide synthase
MVIAYHMGWLSWRFMRGKRLQPWAGLPNILCREFVVPELLQDAATSQALADAVLQWLDARTHAPNTLKVLEEKFQRLHLELQRDTPTIATDAIQKVLQS